MYHMIFLGGEMYCRACSPTPLLEASKTQGNAGILRRNQGLRIYTEEAYDHKGGVLRRMLRDLRSGMSPKWI